MTWDPRDQEVKTKASRKAEGHLRHSHCQYGVVAGDRGIPGLQGLKGDQGGRGPQGLSGMSQINFILVKKKIPTH